MLTDAAAQALAGGLASFLYVCLMVQALVSVVSILYRVFYCLSESHAHGTREVPSYPVAVRQRKQRAASSLPIVTSLYTSLSLPNLEAKPDAGSYPIETSLSSYAMCLTRSEEQGVVT